MINSLKLKGAIVAAGYTQQTLAEKVSMSRNSLSSKINGSVGFTTDEVERICDVLGISNSETACEIFLPSMFH